MFEQCVIYPLESDLGPSEFNVNSHRKHMTHGTYTIAGNWTWMTWYLFVLSVPMATPWNWTIYIYIHLYVHWPLFNFTTPGPELLGSQASPRLYLCH